MNTGISLVNADGSGLSPVTSPRFWSDGNPAWSPDGRRIAFDRQLSVSNTEIYVMSPSGTGLRRLTRSRGGDSDPNWSPDGKEIVFQSQRDRLTSPASPTYLDNELYVLSADGQRLRRVTRNAMNDLDPSWSLSGTAIGFAREGTDGQFDIWVMAPDGTGQQRLTTARGDDRAPAWAPDGKQILSSANGLGPSGPSSAGTSWLPRRQRRRLSRPAR